MSTNKTVFDIESAKELLPRRNPAGNKGTFGKVLIIAGSRNMVGCCVLAAGGALRSGAGLVKLAFPHCLYNALTSRLTENTFLPLKTGEYGEISAENLPLLLNEINGSDAVFLGAGLSVTENTRKICREIIVNSRKPLIIDADGLNCICDSVSVLKKVNCPVLLTPHPGEMSRLTGKSIEYIENNRESVTVEFARQYGVNVLLKGHKTLVYDVKTDILYENTTGNSGLSKGGSGDLLGGIISGLAPNMKTLGESAILGAFIHGRASEFLKDSLTEYSMLPTDCMNILPQVFKSIM